MYSACGSFLARHPGILWVWELAEYSNRVNIEASKQAQSGGQQTGVVLNHHGKEGDQQTMLKLS